MQFFFWLGHGPSPELSTKSKILQMLPSTLFIVYHTCVFTSGGVLQNVYRETYGKHNNLITNFYLITEITTNVILYWQFVVNKGVLNKAVREFHEVAQMIYVNFGCQPELNKPFRRIRMKMFWILLTYTMDSCIYLVPSLKVGKRLGLSLHFDVLQSATTIGCMHGVLYINLLNLYMKTLNQILKCHSMTSEIHHTMGNEQVVLLNKMKMIHFRLWNIAQDINRFFGCGLGAMLLRNFVDSTFGIYWAFLITSNRGTTNLIQLIRTYVCNCSKRNTNQRNLFCKQVHYADSPVLRLHQF